MFARAWLSIAIITVTSWASLMGLYNAIPSYEYKPVEHILFLCAPWLLLFVALKAWYRSFIWRRMLASRHVPPVLSRGNVHTKRLRGGTSILEKLCGAFVLLAIAALLNQFAVTQIKWWIFSLVLIVFFLRLLLVRG